MKNESLIRVPQTTVPNSAPVCWMIVDDNEGVLNFLGTLLEKLGIAEIQRFTTGAEALASLAATPDRFQFVITDLDMPGMNGIELCRRMRELAPQLTIVLATGSGAVSESGAKRHGFSGLLNKPFPVAELWQTLETTGVLNPSRANPNN